MKIEIKITCVDEGITGIILIYNTMYQSYYIEWKQKCKCSSVWLLKKTHIDKIKIWYFALDLILTTT